MLFFSGTGSGWVPVQNCRSIRSTGPAGSPLWKQWKPAPLVVGMGNVMVWEPAPKLDNRLGGLCRSFRSRPSMGLNGELAPGKETFMAIRTTKPEIMRLPRPTWRTYTAGLRGGWQAA